MEKLFCRKKNKFVKPEPMLEEEEVPSCTGQRYKAEVLVYACKEYKTCMYRNEQCKRGEK